MRNYTAKTELSKSPLISILTQNLPERYILCDHFIRAIEEGKSRTIPTRLTRSCVSGEQYSSRRGTREHVALLITPELRYYQSYKQQTNWITITRLLTESEKQYSEVGTCTLYDILVYRCYQCRIWDALKMQISHLCIIEDFRRVTGAVILIEFT